MSKEDLPLAGNKPFHAKQGCHGSEYLKRESLFLLKNMALALTLLLAGSTLLAQSNDTGAHRVIVLGNIADIDDPAGYFQQLKDELEAENTPFTLLAAGDLIDHLISSDTYAEDSAAVATLVQLVEGNPQGKLVILQGDRDWNHSQSKGWKNARDLEELVTSFDQDNVFWVGEEGCPGPEDILLDEHVLLIALNTQWWNHPEDKPQPIDADCKIAMEDDFMEEIEDLIHESGNRNVLIAGHFPLHSVGPYGGKFPLKNYLLPLPLVGSFVSAYHQQIGSHQDIVNENFDHFRQRLDDLINANTQIFYLSGHERNLQILQLAGDYHINSGAPTKASSAVSTREALYAKAHPGFVALSFYQQGSVTANIYGYDQQQGFSSRQQIPLLASACEEKLSGQAPPNESYIPCLQEDPVGQQMAGTYEKPALSVAGSEYKAGPLKKLFLGKHYRTTWRQSVTVPYLHLDTTFGGLTPIKTGGGRQTSSLRFEAGDGYEYTFRSVNKNPEKALSLDLRNTVVAKIFKDQTTTQHPYGAIGVDQMMNALGILHAHPKLYVMPDDEKLGPFRERYGDMLGMLEINPKTAENGQKSYGNADEIMKSHKLFRELYQDHDHRIDQHAYAVARLFDILVGDWSKHEENWKWARYKQGNKHIYRPIPRDRDHVFSMWDGILPWLSDREWTNTNWENFDEEIEGLRSLTYQSRYLDRLVASELTKEDWLQTARLLQEKLTDPVIHASIAQMPAETYALSGETIENKLKVRRDHLAEIANRYYHLLAQQVNVIGSQKEERFDITRHPEGTVEVTMFDEKKSGEKEQLYQRTFYPEETKEIQVYGLGNEDTFVIRGESTASIPVRIVGGNGKDIIIDSSYVKGRRPYTLVYEKSDDAQLDLGQEARMVKARNEASYDFEPTGFHYNTYFPLILPGYNTNDGFSIAAGVNFKRYQYDRQPFSSSHQIGAKITSKGFFRVGYDAYFPQALGQWGILLSALYASPNEDYIFFYGIGNETTKDDQRYADNFYRTRYNSIQVSTGLRKNFWKVSSFSARIGYETNEARIEDNTILEGVDILGIDRLQFFNTQWLLDLDFRDASALPQKGTRLWLRHENGFIDNEGFSNYGISAGEAEFYHTAYWKTPLTLALRAGGADTYGDIPFFKLPTLGQRENLRGYYRNRFTGESSLYLNTELRVALGTIETGFLPFTIGTKGFYDIGRVYYSEEPSDKWHQGYGFGMFVTPLQRSFTLNFSLAFSEEQSALFMFSIGTNFR